MASIKDAFLETFEDNNSFFKILVLSIPLYFCVQPLINGGNTIWWLYLLTAPLLFGFMIKCTYNERNGEANILPNLNIFTLVLTGLKGLVALGPAILVNSMAAYYLCGFIEKYIPDSNVLNVFKFLIWCIFVSIILTCYMGYAKNFKIKDAYNFKAIFESSADIMISMLFMIPQLVLAAAIILLPAGYILWLFFNMTHNISIFLYCLVAVFMLGVTGHYLAQTGYENIQED